MPTVAAIRVVTDEAAIAARKTLTALEVQGKSAGAEGVKLLDTFNRRADELLNKRLDGKISDLDLGRAFESEREALAFNLASVANETARGALREILDGSLRFLTSILGAGLKVFGA